MSVADHNPAESIVPPQTGVTVRLTAEFTNALDTALEGGPTSGAASRAQGAGLLFGTTEKDLITVRACRSFALWDSLQNNSPTTDRELNSLELIGWYGARQGGIGFLPRDVQFHNRHFPRTTDLMLIVNAEREQGPVLELFMRTSRGPLSTEHFLHSSVQLCGAAPLTQPIDLNLVDLNLVEKSDGDESAVPETVAVAPATPPANTIALRPATASRETNGLLWVVSAALLVVAIGMTFAWTHARRQYFALTRESQSVMGRIGPASGLRMRAEESGDGALLSWNHNASAVRSAQQGILHIRDGSEQRTIYLDPSDLANGSIVYRPQSSNANFRLELLGQHGSPLSNDLQTFKRIKSAAGPEISESAVRVADAAETPTRWHRETHGSASTAPAAVSLEPETLPNYVAARALKQVLPDTKLFAVSEIREGAEVDVQARIDEKGVVVEAHVKNGTNDNGSLRSAALEAARQWVFEPAKMDNRNIPSDHTIAFQFH
jgi:hypothetical protein